MTKQKKKILKIAAIVVTVLVVLVSAALLFVGNYMVNFAIVRTDTPADVSPDSVVSQDNQSVIDTNRDQLSAQSDAWLAESEIEEVSITSRDGLNLVGQIIWNAEDSHKWAIVVHGYHSSKEEGCNVGCQFAQQGFNVLFFDHRAHGDSEGTYIGMGWLEKDDLLLWIDLVIEKDPQSQIILHGTSMGGATVMMASGEALPENVKGIIEDCGYASVWNIFADELEYLFGLPTFPVLNAAQFVGEIRAGYNFTEASSVEQVKKATVPMLFIHGSVDTFVVTDAVYEVYEACPTIKDILVVEGAGHAESYAMDPELYFTTMFSFIEENCISE